MDITKDEFIELAEKHLKALEGYEIDENGDLELKIFGFDNLYKELSEILEKKKLQKRCGCNHIDKVFDKPQRIFIHDGKNFVEITSLK